MDKNKYTVTVNYLEFSNGEYSNASSTVVDVEHGTSTADANLFNSYRQNIYGLICKGFGKVIDGQEYNRNNILINGQYLSTDNKELNIEKDCTIYAYYTKNEITITVTTNGVTGPSGVQITNYKIGDNTSSLAITIGSEFKTTGNDSFKYVDSFSVNELDVANGIDGVTLTKTSNTAYTINFSNNDAYFNFIKNLSIAEDKIYAVYESCDISINVTNYDKDGVEVDELVGALSIDKLFDPITFDITTGGNTVCYTLGYSQSTGDVDLSYGTTLNATPFKKSLIAVNGLEFKFTTDGITAGGKMYRSPSAQLIVTLGGTSYSINVSSGQTMQAALNSVWGEYITNYLNEDNFELVLKLTWDDDVIVDYQIDDVINSGNYTATSSIIDIPDVSDIFNSTNGLFKNLNNTPLVEGNASYTVAQYITDTYVLNSTGVTNYSTNKAQFVIDHFELSNGNRVNNNDGSLDVYITSKEIDIESIRSAYTNVTKIVLKLDGSRGDEGKPYLISSEAAWNAILANTMGNGKYYLQTAGLNMNVLTRSNPTFNGYYNGNSNTINRNGDTSPLFGCIDGGRVSNVKIEGDITSVTHLNGWSGNVTQDSWGNLAVEIKNGAYLQNITTGKTGDHNSITVNSGTITKVGGLVGNAKWYDGIGGYYLNDVANNYDITVTNSGGIASGLVAYVTDDNVKLHGATYTNNGAITAENAAGIVYFNGSNGEVNGTSVNNGTINATNCAAGITIFAQAGNVYATHTNNGAITAENAAGIALTSGNSVTLNIGNVGSITNSGAITATTAAGIALTSGNSVTLINIIGTTPTVENTGAIKAVMGAGIAYGSTDLTATNCVNSGVIQAVDGSGNSYGRGLLSGLFVAKGIAKVTDSHNSGAITIDNADSSGNVATGVLTLLDRTGTTVSTTSSVTNCYNEGNITINGTDSHNYVSGIAYVQDNDTCSAKFTIENCGNGRQYNGTDFIDCSLSPVLTGGTVAGILVTTSNESDYEFSVKTSQNRGTITATDIGAGIISAVCQYGVTANTVTVNQVENSGAVTVESSGSVGYASGIASLIGGYDLSTNNCTNSGAIQVNDKDLCMGAGIAICYNVKHVDTIGSGITNSGTVNSTKVAEEKESDDDEDEYNITGAILSGAFIAYNQSSYGLGTMRINNSGDVGNSDTYIACGGMIWIHTFDKTTANYSNVKNAFSGSNSDNTGTVSVAGNGYSDDKLFNLMDEEIDLTIDLFESTTP